MRLGPFLAQKAGYEFPFSIEVPTTNRPAVQEGTFFGSYFECMAFVRCKTEPFGMSSAWWVGYVQTILADTVKLHYSDGAVCELRSFLRRPKDQDLNIGRHIDPRITLFDIQPHVCQRIPIKRTFSKSDTPIEDQLGYVAKKQKEWNLPPTEAIDAAVLFYDKPGVRLGRMQPVYLDGVLTEHQQMIGWTSPFPQQGALLRITGGVRFALWLVLMQDPPMSVLTERSRNFFPGVSTVPLGPQNGGPLDAVYHFIWSVDLAANVAGEIITPTGAGMTLHSHGTGAGIERPTLTGDPATAAMGTEMSLELTEF